MLREYSNAPLKRNRQNSVLITLAAILISAWMMVSAGSACAEADAHLFDTPAWRMIGHLEIRSGDVLLLRLSDRSPVYSYAPLKKQLALAPVSTWKKMPGLVADCELQLPPFEGDLLLGSNNDALFFKGHTVPTAGRTLLEARLSPGKDMVAVVSTTGSKAGSILPFLGAGGASGVHYHEVFKTRDGVRVGNPVRLPIGSAEVAITSCWSADGKYVIYHDIVFSRLVIVEVKKTEGD